MEKILIADKSTVFSKRVADIFSANYDVRICENGEEVLQLCRLWQPDYMLLDLELPLVDGLTILRTLHGTGQMVRVLARTGCIYSDYVMQSLTRFGVNYILPNPCTVTEAASQLNDLISYSTKACWHEDDRIVSMLLHLGFSFGKSGFACLCEALRVMMDGSNLPITKVVYPRVAHICGGNAERVERAIRNAIDKAWKNRDDRIWQYYFTPGRDGQIACPTNGEFISRMALCLNRRKIV